MIKNALLPSVSAEWRPSGNVVVRMGSQLPADWHVWQRIGAMEARCEEWFVLWGDGGKARAIWPLPVCRGA